MTGDSGAVVLGISADYHDAAAALVVDGQIIHAAEEERFTRVKHDPSMPTHAIEWCLDAGGITPGGLDGVVFYGKPLTTYERVLRTHARVGPVGFPRLAQAIATWSTNKLFVPSRIETILDNLGHPMPPLSYAEHHMSHAASAFYPSPFRSAAVITLDGVGEWATATIGHGIDESLNLLVELDFPDSVGLFYSAMTAFCGFDVNDGEYKLMGLAPYGEPLYVDAMRDNLIEIAEDGSVRLDQSWFSYRSGKKMTSRRMGSILDGPARVPARPLGQREADIARSTQVIVEEVVLAVARHAHDLTGERNACLAGGVALNCVANGRLLREGPFDDVWVQPAAGDSGGALGAALWASHQLLGCPRSTDLGHTDGMSGALLGPSFANDEISDWLNDIGVTHSVTEDGDELCEIVASELANGAIVGWFQGPMEFGPRALGCRSILADPRDSTVIDRLNASIKGREGFRPFAPAVLEQHASEWFDVDRPLPYMLFTANVAPKRHLATVAEPVAPSGFAERLSVGRTEIPACTHVDLSARVQTVGNGSSPQFRRLIEAFAEQTGCPVVVNTSFNRAGEPIVRSPADALACFAATNLDVLVLERCVIKRSGLGPVGGPDLEHRSTDA